MVCEKSEEREIIRNDDTDLEIHGMSQEDQPVEVIKENK